MANNAQNIRFTFTFIMPAERIMTVARTHINSPDENYRAVAKAMLDVTVVASVIQQAIAEGMNADLGPYFDFWSGDAIDCANKLLHYEDNDARNLAKCLIELEKAAIKSKESFLAEMKRLGIRPEG